jgi:protein gp37
VKSSISWTGDTWPIVVGCTQVSPGCKHCYAMRSVHRVNLCQAGIGRPAPYANLVELVQLGGRQVPRWTGEVGFFPDRLGEPLSWRAPRKVFVASQSDVFHDRVSNEQVAAIFGAMAATPRHTYQVLTKRPARMRAWFRWIEEQRAIDGDPWVTVLREAASYVGNARADELAAAADFDVPHPWPLPNVWLGTSAEDQRRLDERVPDLLETPAAVRFVSAEPLLERLDLWAYLKSPDRDRSLRIEGKPETPGLDWVIGGCESGPGARPCNSEWLRSLRDQCAAAGAAWFLKQSRPAPGVTVGEGSHRHRGVIELPYLDGVQHAAFPAVAHG